MSRKDPARKQRKAAPAEVAATPEYVRGLVARGEAARPNPDGSLPAGATHEIVSEQPDGTPVVRRRRFSAF